LITDEYPGNDGTRFDGGWRGHSLWTWIFLALTGALCSTILLKVAAIQYLELLYASQLFLLLYVFAQRGFKVRLLRPSVVLGGLYLVFMAAALVLSVVGLRNQFFYSSDLSLLKHPVWITVSRIVELIIDAGIMIYLVQEFCGDRRTLVFTMKMYFWTGVASALYSFLTYPLNVLHIADLGTYNADHRLRGFYNEGGPYGLYLLSAILIGVALYKLNGGSRNSLRAGLALLFVAVVGSKSKAAVSAAIAMMLVNVLLVQGAKRRAAVFAVFLVGAIALSLSVDLPQQLRAYQRNAALYERLSNANFNDANLVYGRIAGAFIVPRIVAAHPILGVGWGNYGLVRNNPEYRGASTWVSDDGEAALGLLGQTADLGIPLTLLLTFCLMFPYLYLRRIQAPLYIKNLALLQPIIHLFGGQLNLTYPWVVTAFALGLGYIEGRATLRRDAAGAAVLGGAPVLT
jgi:hypothetical protein